MADELSTAFYPDFYERACKKCPVGVSQSHGIFYCNRLGELWGMINKAVGANAPCWMDKNGSNYQATLSYYWQYFSRLGCPLQIQAMKEIVEQSDLEKFKQPVTTPVPSDSSIANGTPPSKKWWQN